MLFCWLNDISARAQITNREILATQKFARGNTEDETRDDEWHSNLTKLCKGKLLPNLGKAYFNSSITFFLVLCRTILNYFGWICVSWVNNINRWNTEALEVYPKGVFFEFQFFLHINGIHFTVVCVSCLRFQQNRQSVTKILIYILTCLVCSVWFVLS